MSDRDELLGYVDIWRSAVDDFTSLLQQVPEHAWAQPTDLPGWTVHDIAAHVAHLEAVAAGVPHDEAVDIGTPEHVRSPLGAFTEQGVIARRDRSPHELIHEIRRSSEVRETQLREQAPDDANAPADGVFGAIGWTWRTLLRNRPLDVCMHEQDIRRAVTLPGNLHSAAMDHTISYATSSLPMVVGKRVSAAPGTTVTLLVDGSAPVSATVDADGRARLLTEAPDHADARVGLTRAAWLVAAGGRRRPEPGGVHLEGNTVLAQQVLDNLGTTP